MSRAWCPQCGGERGYAPERGGCCCVDYLSARSAVPLPDKGTFKTPRAALLACTCLTRPFAVEEA